MHCRAEPSSTLRGDLTTPEKRDGASSTRLSATGDTLPPGVDTWRLLFKADASSAGSRIFDLPDGYVGQWFPEHGTLAVEGHPAGRGVLAEPGSLPGAFERVCEHVERFGHEFRGISRSDLTAGYEFHREGEARAFFAGMAAMELPRMETTRRGSPVHSVWWTGRASSQIKCRVYDKGLERGGEPFEVARFEDQRRYPSGGRVELDAVSDVEFCREKFARRFAPLRKAVDGVRCASLPVLAQAIADEARYGYRDPREAERMAGAMVLLAGGAGEAYGRRTFYRRRAELRDAGFVLADSWMEPVEVDMAEVVESVVDSWT